MGRGWRDKTLMMQLVEMRFNGSPVETLMVEAYRLHGTEQAAAAYLGITQQTFNTWKYRLGIDKAISALAQRGHAADGS